MQDKYISISQLTRYIKFKFDHDEHLGHVFLRGEISNFKAHTRGHYYFTLKDETSRINAVMFSSNASKLLFRPTDGMKVLVTGRVSVYEATGGYQIYVEDMVEDGVGNLYVQFEELKKKLQQEGLFDPSKKKKIPKIPKTVGIITAPTGAAIRDILSTIKRRWPITKTILFPSLVQGASAAPEIIKQIEKAQEFDLDVLIVGRGGGSIEDMWCFNDEQVARAIYACKIPVISAVGHEIDFTISDFVADLRAPTPTGAAEMAVPNISDFYQYFGQIELRLEQAIMTMITSKKDQLETLKKSYILTNPIAMYQVKEQRFDSLFEKIHLLMNSIIANEKNNCQILKQKLENNIQKVLENEQHRYLHALNKLEILNPLLTIKRGYSITRNQDHVVTSIQQVKPHDKIEIEVTDGLIEARVEEVKS
jgi:exodeoxyribonuclease VII, large subunit